MKYPPFLCLALLLASCGQTTGDKATSDLPARADRWVQAVATQPDTKIEHVGKTSTIAGSTSVTQLPAAKRIAIGDTIDGVTVGAIKCTFFPHDSAYGGEQFMWRGRWGCMAGRSQAEVAGAVKDDGTKAFDYINLSPVTI